MISHGKNVKVFCANANRPFAEGVCRKLWLPLGDCTVTTFADGEVSLTINESVRGSDVFLVQSTCKPVNNNLMELLIMIDALKRASAGRITAVIPYFDYACTTNTSLPRTVSYRETDTSPSAKDFTSDSPSLVPISLQISSASLGVALPENTLMSLP